MSIMAVMSNPSERMKGLTWREERGKDRSTGTSRRQKAPLLQRDRSPAEREARERLETLAMRASFNLLVRLRQQLEDSHAWQVRLELHDLEGVVDVLTFCIEDLNNWKGVLQWLNDTV